MKHPKPEPVVVVTLCSLCNEPWAAHGDDPTSIDCIRLLRARIARSAITTIINRPYVVPTWPHWSASASYGMNAVGGVATVTYLTPRTDDGPEGAVA